MDGKLLWTLSLVGILIVIGPASGCKHCGIHWCSCGGSNPMPLSRSWQMERSPPPTPIALSLPMMQQQPSIPRCQYCGGQSRGYNGYIPRNEVTHSCGYYCRCSPRRQHSRYDNY